MTEPLHKPHIVVDLSDRTVRVYDDGELVKEAPCSIGMKGFRTPRGIWELGQRSLTPDWRAPAWAAAYGMRPNHVYEFGQAGNPYSGGLIQLVGKRGRAKDKTGYALHGSTNKQSIRDRLAASHGCIRIPDWFVRWLYERCPAGTPVITRR